MFMQYRAAKYDTNKTTRYITQTFSAWGQIMLNQLLMGGKVKYLF